MATNDTKQARRTAEAIKREAHAIELRIAGWTTHAIAQEMGIHRTRVQQIIQQGLNRTIARPAAEWRAIELRRLERLHQAMWSKAIVEKNTMAVKRLLEIADRRAKLLGLDAPTQVEIVEDSGERAERLATELRAFLSGAAARQGLDEERIRTAADVVNASDAVNGSNGTNGHR